MKKLLLTSALISLGSLSILGTANSQTKITGELKGAYKNVEQFTSGAAELSGFTSERQINFEHAATLNNGLKFTAGFSLEQDGDQSGNGTVAIDGLESNWVNFTSGATTFEIGMDHIQNTDRNLGSRVGLPISEVVGSWGGAVSRVDSPVGLQYQQAAFTNKEKMGLGVIQNVGTGNASFNYIPRTTDTANVADTNVPAAAAGKGAYELTYFGTVPGVKGLSTNLGYNVQKKNGTDVQDQKLKLYSLTYALDSFAVGIEKRDADLATNADQDSMEYSLSYKISPLASVGIGKIETEGKNTTGAKFANKEKINYVQVGYSLGAIYGTLNYVDAENIAYSATQDAKAWVANFGVKF